MNDPRRARSFAAPADPPGGWPDESRRPATAWSSMTGAWRQVPITPASKRQAAGRYVVLLGFSAVTALLTVQSSARSGAGPLQVAFGFVAVLLAVVGIAGFVRQASTPRRASYVGQLVAAGGSGTPQANRSGPGTWRSTMASKRRPTARRYGSTMSSVVTWSASPGTRARASWSAWPSSTAPGKVGISRRRQDRTRTRTKDMACVDLGGPAWA